MDLDSRIVDILLSRLLHDLISPATATLNGIELVEDFGGKEQDPIVQEALGLVSTSVRQSTDRLGFFRMAFGGAGNGGDHSIDQIRRHAEAYLGSRNIECEVQADGAAAELPPAGFAKAVLGGVFLIADALPRSGRVEVEIKGGAEDADWCAEVRGVGQGAALDPRCVEALSNADAMDVDAMDTKSVTGFIVPLMARRMGINLEYRSAPGEAAVEIKLGA